MTDKQPCRVWRGAPPVGAKAPDVPCTLVDISVTRPLWLREGTGPLVRQPYPPELLRVFEEEDIPYCWQDYADEEAAA